MSAIDKIKQKILYEICVDLSDLFDKSFETKSFNNKPWKNRKIDIRGTLMMQTGTLRRSLKASINGNTIQWTSNLPYAKIQNEGGKIKVTPKMKKYFWAKYRELTPKIKRKKNGELMKSSLGVSKIANFYKAMALKPIGSFITIPQRQFIGFSPETDKRIKNIINTNMQKLADAIIKHSKK
ncbi:MAG: phage virion morphogenesis protein [Bacteroidales bacterium]|nr:phage virion morphogenesis protein [Bacteroidales bacterium]